MNNNRILNVEYPVITSYPVYANLLSALANQKNLYNWFYNNFIQLWAPQVTGKTQWFPIKFHPPFMLQICPCINYNCINYQLLNHKWDSVLEFVKDSIDFNNYIIIYVDQYFLPPSQNFNNKHFLHELFIYGYDFDKKTLCVADFFKDGKYSFETISFEEFETAYLSSFKINERRWMAGAILFSLRENESYQLDIDIIKNYLHEFLNSNSSTELSNSRIDYKKDGDILFGLNVYQELVKYLNICLSSSVFDIRPFYTLYDHKMALYLKIKFLLENKFLRNEEILVKSESNLNNFKLLLDYSLKYSITKKDSTIEKIKDKLERNVLFEKEMLIELHSYLGRSV